MMRYLIISLSVLLVACGSYPKKQKLQATALNTQKISNIYFADKSNDYVYKANIDIYNNTFGGLLIIKKINDDEHRIAFTTEMGNKIFDFSFIGDLFKVNFIIDDLDKAILINILRNDFKVLIQESLDIIQAYKLEAQDIYEVEIGNKSYYYFVNDSINKIIKVGNGKEKVRFLFSEINNTIATRIEIIHSNIDLSIKLKSIQ